MPLQTMPLFGFRCCAPAIHQPSDLISSSNLQTNLNDFLAAENYLQKIRLCELSNSDFALEEVKLECFCVGESGVSVRATESE